MIHNFIIQKDWEYGEDGVYTKFINADTKEIVLDGDWYHNKIDDQINGFIACLNYLPVSYTVSKVDINKEEDEHESV